MKHRSEYIRHGHEVTRLAFTRLRSAIKAKHGYGAIKRLEKDLGFEDGWFRWHARRGATMSLENALACLLWAEISPREFFDDLFSETLEDNEISLPVECHPWIVDILCTAPTEEKCWTSVFWNLDRSRYDDPLQALRQLVDCAPSIPEFHKVDALAVAGSCYRSLYSIPSALCCLLEARDLNKDPWREGELLQRLLSCLHPSNPRKALRLGRRAQLIFSTLGDRVKVAETLVDQAMTLGVMGDLVEAKKAFANAYDKHRDYLSPRYRVAALQGLSECCIRQNKNSEAMDWLIAARDELRGNADSSNIRAHLLWSSGKIEKSLTTLSSAIDTFGTEHFFEASSVALDYCELAVESGARAKATTMANTMAKVASEVEDHVILRMFENLLAQLEMRRVIDWAQQQKTIQSRRERWISSLLPSGPTNRQE